MFRFRHSSWSSARRTEVGEPGFRTTGINADAGRSRGADTDDPECECLGWNSFSSLKTTGKQVFWGATKAETFGAVRPRSPEQVFYHGHSSSGPKIFRQLDRMLTDLPPLKATPAKETMPLPSPPHPKATSLWPHGPPSYSLDKAQWPSSLPVPGKSALAPSAHPAPPGLVPHEAQYDVHRSANADERTSLPDKGGTEWMSSGMSPPWSPAPAQHEHEIVVRPAQHAQRGAGARDEDVPVRGFGVVDSSLVEGGRRGARSERLIRGR